MAKKEVRKIGPLTEGKKKIISRLLEEYEIEDAKDIQDALADLLGGTIKGMMKAEMNSHLGYEKSERSDNENARNGYKKKRVRSSYGEFDIEVPQDRNSDFEPQIVQKREKDISEIERKIIAMYVRGMTTRQVSEQIEEIYGFDVSEGFISNAIESLNSTYKRLNRQRSVFPNEDALLKALYLETQIATKKWTQNLRNWGKVYVEFQIMYPDRMPK